MKLKQKDYNRKKKIYKSGLNSSVNTIKEKRTCALFFVVVAIVSHASICWARNRFFLVQKCMQNSFICEGK